MSYNVYLTIEVDTGGVEEFWVHEIGNMTYNVSPMFYKALGEGGLNGLHGKAGGDVIRQLNAAYTDMFNNAEEYKKLNPVNGWGSYEGALEFLNKLLNGCENYPKAIIRIS